jgi:hypothetical protein
MYPDVRLVEGVVSYLHRDQLVSFVSVTDGTAAKAREAVFRPFGDRGDAQILLPGVAAEAKGFIGERYDAGAGLHYLNARYYDPELGLLQRHSGP